MIVTATQPWLQPSADDTLIRELCSRNPSNCSSPEKFYRECCKQTSETCQSYTDGVLVTKACTLSLVHNCSQLNSGDNTTFKRVLPTFRSRIVSRRLHLHTIEVQLQTCCCCSARYGHGITMIATGSGGQHRNQHNQSHRLLNLKSGKELRTLSLVSLQQRLKAESCRTLIVDTAQRCVGLLLSLPQGQSNHETPQ